MYIKINWENKTVDLVKDSEVENVKKNKPIWYEIKEEWFSAFEFVMFDSIEAIYNTLLEDENIEDTIACAIEDDDFYEEHNLTNFDWDEAIEKCKEHKEWIRAFLEKHSKEFIITVYEDSIDEYIKIPD